MSASPSPSLYRAHPAVMLFGRFLDGQILENVNLEVKDIVSMIFGATEYIKLTRELELVSALLYYSACLLSQGASLGQLFCNLRPYQIVYDNNKEFINRNISQRRFAYAAFLYAFLPYLYHRRSEITISIKSFWNILMEPESLSGDQDVDCTGTSDICSDQSGDFTNNDDDEEQITSVVGENSTASEDQANEYGSDSSPIINKYKNSFLEVIITALYRSYMVLSHESNLRLQRLFNFFLDIHQLAFAATSKYLEIPLQMSSLQLFSESLPPTSSFQIKLNGFAWMIAIRIVLLTYYATRVITNEIDLQQLPQESSQNDVRSASFDSQIRTIQTLGNCPLCLDGINFPAALPCGHICCWDCITGYAFSRRPTSSAAGHKCPVCRQSFLSSGIRAIHM